MQVAEKTSEVARGTLVEMHRQGQQLERADLGMQQASGGWWAVPSCAAVEASVAPTLPCRNPAGAVQVEQEAREASAILRFMRRWCCFQCCCCYDPTADQDRTRRQRVSA
mgnify:CR=1 FL=1